MNTLATLKKHLTKRKVRFDVVTHKKVFTVHDLGQTLKIKLNTIAKTLLLKVDRPAKLSEDPAVVRATKYLLVVVPAHLRLDLAKVKKILGAKNVSIASEKDMTNVMKVKPGALTPFGTLHKLGVLMDKALLRVPKALFGSGSFTESLRLKVKDFHKHEQPLTGDVTEKKR